MRHLSLQDGNPRNPLLPLRRPGHVHAGSLRVHGHGDGQVAHVELVDGFRAQVLEGCEARVANGRLWFHHHGELMRRNRELDGQGCGSVGMERRCNLHLP